MPGKAGDLAEALYALDRLDEADAWAGRAAELDTSSSAWKWRQVKAKVLARRGEHVEGEVLAREAVAIVEVNDSLDLQGDAYADLAEVLALAGKPDEAASALEQALERYERKENLVSAQRTHERLAKLRAATPR
jgi:tetratricopeptide (TPR) repeat protein